MIKQTLTKTVLVKVNGSWKKLQKDTEVPTQYTSWKSINLLIDTILDQSVDDYAILHKPFIPVLVWHSRNWHKGSSGTPPDPVDFKSKPSNPTDAQNRTPDEPSDCRLSELEDGQHWSSVFRWCEFCIPSRQLYCSSKGKLRQFVWRWLAVHHNEVPPVRYTSGTRD